MKDALGNGAVIRNPTEGTELPRIPQTETQWYAPDALSQLFERTEGDRFHALWLVLGTLGLRLGEALGLKWSDIDWQRHSVTVQRTCQRNRLTGALELAETKTAGSRRTLTLPIETERALLAHKDRQRQDKNREREVWQHLDLIFCTITGGPMDQGRIHHFWTAACKKADIPRYRPHDLRHSVASNLIAAGMGLLEVARMLGHQNGAMVTTVYGHVAPDDHGRAATLMDALLTRETVI